MGESKYIHTEDVHNMNAPREIVPELISIFNPKSVVDIGCGLGTFAAAFLENGVKDVLGVDGSWVDDDLRKSILANSNFLCHSLDIEIDLPQRYDLAISLEVAEHIAPENADTFVQNLVSASDTIVFSAAIPFQGGQNHLNEQWLDYWVLKFEEHGYQFYDVLRNRFWENQNVFHWYKQNMVVFSKKDLSNIDSTSPRDLVHPDFFLNKAVRLENMMNGTHVPKYYLKLLWTSIYLTLKGKRKDSALQVTKKDF